MRVHLVCTLPHRINIYRMLGQRLMQVNCSCELKQADEMVSVSIEDTDHRSVETFYSALAVVLGRDLARREIFTLVAAVPLCRAEKTELLCRAFHHARLSEQLGLLRQNLKQCLEQHDTLDLEGFRQFRMQQERLIWRLCIRQSAEEIRLLREIQELTRVLLLYLRSAPQWLTGDEPD